MAPSRFRRLTQPGSTFTDSLFIQRPRRVISQSHTGIQVDFGVSGENTAFDQQCRLSPLHLRPVLTARHAAPDDLLPTQSAGSDNHIPRLPEKHTGGNPPGSFPYTAQLIHLVGGGFNAHQRVRHAGVSTKQLPGQTGCRANGITPQGLSRSIRLQALIVLPYTIIHFRHADSFQAIHDSICLIHARPRITTQ